MSQGDHVRSKDVLEVSGRWEGEVGDGPLVPLAYCDGKSHPSDLLLLPWNSLLCLTNFCLMLADDAIRKKLVLDPDMTKVRQALSIPAKFREWRWLLSEHRKEVGGLPLLKILKGGSRAAWS